MAEHEEAAEGDEREREVVDDGDGPPDYGGHDAHGLAERPAPVERGMVDKRGSYVASSRVLQSNPLNRSTVLSSKNGTNNRTKPLSNSDLLGDGTGQILSY